MHPNRRLSILPFPQHFGNGTMALNIVVLPRNQNPLEPAIAATPPIPDSGPFADAQFSFEAHIVSSLAGFPNNRSLPLVRPAPIQHPPNLRALVEALRQ